MKELLNFFPVYGEDETGAMVELDAEAVLTISRRIHAREVVERGFMSNFLFANISGIFAAPREVIDVINNMQLIEEPKTLPKVNIDGDTVNVLHINEEGSVEIPDEVVIGRANDIFGEKVYADVSEKINDAAENILKEYEKSPESKNDELSILKERLGNPFAATLMETAKKQYGNDLKK